MIRGFFLLIGCDLLGEAVRDVTHLPMPGPVIGMLLLAAFLIATTRLPHDLESSAETLIVNMGLLFVPAGVGVITQTSLLATQWLPIIGGLIGSTLLSLIATALTMHLALRRRGTGAAK